MCARICEECLRRTIDGVRVPESEEVFPGEIEDERRDNDASSRRIDSELRHRVGCIIGRSARTSPETYQLLSYGMAEAEVVGRTGQPDRRLDQFEPTSLGQRLISYQYIWGGETSKGE